MLYKDTLSVEKGLAVCKAFFFHLWPLIEAKSISLQSNQEAYEDTKIFCQRTCKVKQICKRTGNSAEWNEAIFRSIQISKENQKELKLTENSFFLSMTEFCKIYNKRYDSNLHFLVELLVKMNEHPNNYQEEWQLLENLIVEMEKQSATPLFDWNETFSEKLELSVEEGFTVCINFFIDLWNLIESKLPLPKDLGVHGTHDLFCRTVCGEAASGPAPEGHAEWNEVIFRVKQIPKKNQEDLKLTVDEVFFLMMEFCKFYNKTYEQYGDNCNLHYLLELLESIKQNPKNYPKEWQLFKEAVADAKSGHIKIYFNWSVDFYE